MPFNSKMVTNNKPPLLMLGNVELPSLIFGFIFYENN